MSNTPTSNETAATALESAQQNPPRPALAYNHPPSIVLFLAIAIGLLAADLALKYWSFHHVAGSPVEINVDAPYESIPSHDPVTLIPSVLSLRLTLNTGAIFGVAKGGRWFFILVSVIAIIVIPTFFARSPRSAKLTQIGLGMILAGALGNLYDRFTYSAVRDMLYLFPDVKLPFGLRWPGGNGQGSDELYPWIFNLADAVLLVGLVFIFITTLRSGKPQPVEQSSRD